MTDTASDTDRARRALILWALVARGGSALQGSLKPELKKSDRDALIAAGWLSWHKDGRAIRVELTEPGWAWAATNTEATLPRQGNGGTAVLGDFLACLGRYLATREVHLREFIRPAARPLPALSPPASPRLAERIRAAYLAETGGVIKRPARLAGIRARLADVDRADLDAALVALELSGTGATLPFDDPTEITAADHAAAIAVGGEKRHLLWLDR
jgi:hypothetical protein